MFSFIVAEVSAHGHLALSVGPKVSRAPRHRARVDKSSAQPGSRERESRGPSDLPSSRQAPTPPAVL